MAHGIEVLRILSDGRFHSGEQLGSALGLSRSGIWKQLRHLRSLGLELDSITGKGYRLARSLELLDAGLIRAGLSATASRAVSHIEIHPEIDSTSSECLRRASELPSGTVCLAESQTAGRGRLNRRWISPFARNLCLSLLWRFDRGPDSLGGLGLAAGVAVLRALDETGARELGLKWPNDILCRDAKLAGILIELSGESAGSACAVIGVGINVDLPPEAGQEIDQPWADLATVCNVEISRNRLASRVISQLIEALMQFGQAGLAAFLDEWRRRDRLRGRPVSIRTFAHEEQGTARGIDASGALLVEVNGQVRRYLSGDVSVRSIAESDAVAAP